MTNTPDTLIGDTAEQLLGAAIRCRRTARATAAELLWTSPDNPTYLRDHTGTTDTTSEITPDPDDPD